MPCPCYSAACTEGTLQGKLLTAKTQDKGETRTKPLPVLSPIPQARFQTLAHRVEENAGKKLPSPRRTY